MHSHGNLKLPRDVAKVFWLVIALALTLRSFRFFPGMEAVTNMWLAIGVLYLVGPYLLSKMHAGFALPAFESYVLLLIVVIPVIASISALNVFSQPLYYGIGSQRSVVLCAGSLALIHAYKRGAIGIRHIEQAFIYLAWGTLCLYTAMTLFIDPASMTGDEGFIKGGTIQEANFNFNPVFIIFGFIYYVMAGYVRNNTRLYILALPFLSYVLVIDTGRAKLLAMLIAVAICVVRYGQTKRVLSFSIWASVAILMLGLFFYTFDAEFSASRISKFSDAFWVLATGEAGADESANQRIFETLTAMPYITEHWLMGSGRVSPQWNGGYTGVIGNYFYPGDIGLLGALFMYGLLGCLFYSIQFYFAWRSSRRIMEASEHFIFVVSVSGYMWYYAIHSLAAGMFIHFVEISILMAAVLYCAGLAAPPESDYPRRYRIST